MKNDIIHKNYHVFGEVIEGSQIKKIDVIMKNKEPAINLLKSLIKLYKKNNINYLYIIKIKKKGEKLTRRLIIERLCDNGFDTYLVGGYVRDLMCGLVPKDDDVVTAATHNELEKLFYDCKIKKVGAIFQVILIDDVDVATFRHDRYDENGNLLVNCAKTIHEDLPRRDLTMNSMAVCQYTGDIIDPFGGLSDLKNRIIKFVLNPYERINQDPCRILRACRFKALIEGEFDPETKIALTRNAKKIKTHVANERIRIEILKVMEYKNPSIFFQALHDIGGLQYVFPSLEETYAYGKELHGQYHNESIIEHSFVCGDVLPKDNVLLRLTGYLHDVGKYCACKYDVEKDRMTFHMHETIGCDILKNELKELTFSNEEINYISSLTRFHMRGIGTPKATSKLLKKLKENDINYNDFLKLKVADCHANTFKEDYTKNEILKFHEKIKNAFNHGLPKDLCELAIKGNDIMDVMNIPQGKEVGEIKQQLLDIVNDSPRLNNKKDLLKLLERIKDGKDK